MSTRTYIPVDPQAGQEDGGMSPPPPNIYLLGAALKWGWRLLMMAIVVVVLILVALLFSSERNNKMLNLSGSGSIQCPPGDNDKRAPGALLIIPHFTGGKCNGNDSCTAAGYNTRLMEGPKCNPADTTWHDPALCAPGPYYGTDCDKLFELYSHRSNPTQTGGVCTAIKTLGQLIRNNVTLHYEIFGVYNAGPVFGSEIPIEMALPDLHGNGTAYDITMALLKLSEMLEQDSEPIVDALPFRDQLNLLLPGDIDPLLGPSWKPRTIHLSKAQARVLMPPSLFENMVIVNSEVNDYATLPVDFIDSLFIAASDFDTVSPGYISFDHDQSNGIGPTEGPGGMYKPPTFHDLENLSLPNVYDSTGIALHEFIHSLGYGSYVDNLSGVDGSAWDTGLPANLYGLPVMDLLRTEELQLGTISSLHAYTAAPRYLDRVYQTPTQIAEFNANLSAGVLPGATNVENGNHVVVYDIKKGQAEWFGVSGGRISLFTPGRGDQTQDAHARSLYRIYFAFATLTAELVFTEAAREAFPNDKPVLPLMMFSATPNYRLNPTFDDMFIVDASGWDVDWSKFDNDGLAKVDYSYIH